MFTITRLAEMFATSEEAVEQSLFAAGFSPVDYGDDGQTPHFSCLAGVYLLENYIPSETTAPTITVKHDAALAPAAWKAQL